MLPREFIAQTFRDRVFKNISLKQEELLSFLQFVQVKQYPRKTFLLTAGDKWDKSFYIHQGLLRLFYSDIQGREFNKSFFWEGHCIWPVAPKDRNEKALFNIACIEEVTVFEFSFKRLQAMLVESGNWERFALPYAETLVEQKFQREHDFLLLSATQRFKIFSKTHHAILARLADYHLASYLGITNVSLSRIKHPADL